MAMALLDINEVIALLDQGHLLHVAATNLLAQELHHGWSTCPITENGVVRIMAQPAYPNPQPAALVAASPPLTRGSVRTWCPRQAPPISASFRMIACANTKISPN
jgi:predicted nucleic acid-binding protein